MRKGFLCFSLLCLGMSSQSYANDGEAIQIIEGIEINGLSLKSSPEDIDAYFAQFGEKANCQVSKIEQKDNRGKIFPRSYSWNCSYQEDITQMPQWRMSISYIHDQVASIDYGGPTPETLNGQDPSSYVLALDDKLKNNAAVNYDYKYREYGETVEAEEHAIVHSLMARVTKLCALEAKWPIDYTVEGSIVYSDVPSSAINTITVKLVNGYYSRCKKTLN